MDIDGTFLLRYRLQVQLLVQATQMLHSYCLKHQMMQSYCLRQSKLLIQVTQVLPKHYQSYCSIHYLTLPLPGRGDAKTHPQLWLAFPRSPHMQATQGSFVFH